MDTKETTGGAGWLERATDNAGVNGAAVEQRGRMSAKRKQSAVLRLLRGEDLDLVSRELGVTAADLSGWRDGFLAAGEASLKSRALDSWDSREQPSQGEGWRADPKEGFGTRKLVETKIDRLEHGHPLARRRRKR